MSNERNLIKLEKDIKTKMNLIKDGKLLPKDSGIGKMINLMKSLDEPLYDRIMVEYKKILSNLNDK
jgi:hypothetical protein